MESTDHSEKQISKLSCVLCRLATLLSWAVCSTSALWARAAEIRVCVSDGWLSATEAVVRILLRLACRHRPGNKLHAPPSCQCALGPSLGSLSMTPAPAAGIKPSGEASSCCQRRLFAAVISTPA